MTQEQTDEANRDPSLRLRAGSDEGITPHGGLRFIGGLLDRGKIPSIRALRSALKSFLRVNLHQSISPTRAMRCL